MIKTTLAVIGDTQFGTKGIVRYPYSLYSGDELEAAQQSLTADSPDDLAKRQQELSDDVDTAVDTVGSAEAVTIAVTSKGRGFNVLFAPLSNFA